MRYVLGLDEINQAEQAVVGAKAAKLAALSHIDGMQVPNGFCVTTDAFRQVMADASSVHDRLDRLSRLEPENQDAIRTMSSEIRRRIEGMTVPADLVTAIGRALTRLGDHAAYAVRSSATAEDLPTASFAGQQDSYLNVVGRGAILSCIRRCWASLFTERAVTYRLQNGFDHRKILMAVLVQQMVFADAAGVMFTADPVTSDRKVVCIEAGFGLGEGLVSGTGNADIFTVRNDEVVTKTLATKRNAICASSTGGTRTQAIEPERQQQPALTDAQVVRLARLGRRVEAHFGCPQDIEWCLVDDRFQLVQSRPITTLFPIPEVDDRDNHVYVSVGHQQMMTDAMKPLGLAFWQLTTPRPMAEAGGRLFVDVTRALASPASRAGILDMLGRSDPLIKDALQTVLERGDFIELSEDGPEGDAAAAVTSTVEADPRIVAELIERSEVSVAALARDIRTKSGPALFDFILDDLQELKRILFAPRSHQVIMVGMEAAWWLNDHLAQWLDERNAADVLTQSVPHNVTSEMGLALLDLADAMRPHPDVVAFLQRVEDDSTDDSFVAELVTLPGGREAQAAIRSYLDKYGMRCTGEIDITRPRWSEQPATLVPTILNNIKNFEPGAAERRREEGRGEARKKEQELLTRLRALPDGRQQADETKRMIERVRTFAGYREYPKYGMVSRYFIYKQALLNEAERLAEAGAVCDKEDVFYLRFEEFRDAARTGQVDHELIRRRRDAFRSYQALTPPRVLTSDGEGITGAYRREDLPPGALPGLPVSAGTVEGRARVIVDLAQADLEAGDILVTAYTDPSWTPLFVAATGLVTEVGGLMTHGAVIAREYGLPAVVGVENATRLIRDGQRIRVHGTEGYVELLPP
jgi:rifampicin phosphotransferase